MEIREISAEKKAIILKICEKSGNPVSERWINGLIKTGEKFFVAEQDKVVGILALNAFYKYDKRGIEADLIAVDEDYWGKGIGLELGKKAEEFAKEQGKSMIYLMVSADNQKAIGFYNKAGYKVCGQLNDRYGKGKHSLIMRKQL